MSAQSSGEKTEKATPKRRREAKEKGQVFKSAELITAVSLLVMFGVLSIFGKVIVDNTEALMRFFFSENEMPDAVDVSVVGDAMSKAVVFLLQIIAPVLIARISGCGGRQRAAGGVQFFDKGHGAQDGTDQHQGRV